MFKHGLERLRIHAECGLVRGIAQQLADVVRLLVDAGEQDPLFAHSGPLDQWRERRNAL